MSQLQTLFKRHIVGCVVAQRNAPSQIPGALGLMSITHPTKSLISKVVPMKQVSPAKDERGFFSYTPKPLHLHTHFQDRKQKL
ncbi:hypothetical protein [Chlorogloeopsis sp. ULAP02]|uniref:hypothetical protein n=1 Tax=Chlorogloeopsis sp. ULAP02 TaxID=3107926 RepID=UPI0031354A71